MPRKTVDEKRMPFTVRFSSVELAAMRDAAKRLGVSVGKFVRDAVIAAMGE